jgi:hypothetical protein
VDAGTGTVYHVFNMKVFKSYSTFSAGFWIQIRIRSGSVTLWIRIRIGNPDPDPGARKLINFSGKMPFLVNFFMKL